MKIRESLARYHYFIYALFFGVQAWFSLHRKIVVYEAILYSVALAASLFLAVMTLSGWGTKKPEQAAGQGEHQEDMTP